MNRKRSLPFATLLAVSAAAILACHAPSGGSDSADDSPGDPNQLAVWGDGGKTDAGDAGACPPGVGARWTCDGTRRVRCVDDRRVTEECASGCTNDADEAVCSCGSQTTLSRWNCLPTGLGSCAGGKSWIVDSCDGNTCASGGDGVSDTCTTKAAFADRIQQLGASCGALASGVQCSITVRDLVTNAQAEYRSQVPFVSASSAKSWWVAAALFDTKIDAVAPYAHDIFVNSDNIATGHVLDLLSFPERVNTFLWNDVEAADIGFCSWNYGGTRNANNCPGVMGKDNFFTTNEAVRFLSRVWDHSLLGADKSKQLLEWMTLSPRQGYGGWLGTQLPSDARKAMHHKAGWRPPNAIPGYSNANEVGIVEIPGGHAYAVSFALSGAPSQAAYDNEELPLLEYLSCGVYHAVAGDSAASCTPP
jgi:beta-lactamase class A